MKHPTPWGIQVSKGYATVVDAKAQTIPIMTDIELGWTDRSTGAYHEPQEDLALLQHVVSCVNSRPALEQAFIAMGKTGANADIHHPLRRAWEGCRAFVSSSP